MSTFRFFLIAVSDDSLFAACICIWKPYQHQKHYGIAFKLVCVSAAPLAMRWTFPDRKLDINSFCYLLYIPRVVLFNFLLMPRNLIVVVGENVFGEKLFNNFYFHTLSSVFVDGSTIVILVITWRLFGSTAQSKIFTNDFSLDSML